MLDLKRILSNKGAVATEPLSASEEGLRSELATVQADLTRAYADLDRAAVTKLRERREVLLADLRNLEEERSLRDDAERFRTAEENQRLAQIETERMETLKAQLMTAGANLEDAARSVQFAWEEFDGTYKELSSASAELTRLRGKRGRNQDPGAPAITRLSAEFLGAAARMAAASGGVAQYRAELGDASTPDEAHAAWFRARRRPSEKPLLFRVGVEPRGDETHESGNEPLEGLREKPVVQGPSGVRWP